MKELHSFGWYASKISPHLPKKAFKPVPARLLGGLAYLFVVVSGMLAISTFDLPLILNLAISLIIGTSFAAMGFLGHEILHGTVVRKAWLRNFLGAVFFWPLVTGPRLWRKWHNMTHHVHTQDEENDPDTWLSKDKVDRSPLLRWIYRLPFSVRAFFEFLSLSFTFTLHSTRMFFIYVKEFKVEKRWAVWMQFVLPWVTWIGLMFFVGLTNWLFIFLVPLLIANAIVMGYISTNHRLNPQVEVNDPLANSLSVTVPKWINVLHFNFSYHTEHHLFPSMSSKYYPLVKEQIKKKWPDLYHEMPMTSALKALWNTPRIYYNGNELIDPSKDMVYGSLGHGLNYEAIEPRQRMESPTNDKKKA
ncbi:acyl-CoA desaturase [Salipaludibacillus keqinensis]|uniref:Acyl-CoA desaturase n=1 Tax=Salipaludibacillus keqinensis TaxID=2045207 RepID=A0A323TI28_9BACI|nr:acyl-CoA desaturase [Salipaludibacillus keqinensis]PYZ92293.1 acyl-CoA desaturase [Salipaludibacillus keqinensis]